MKNGLAGETAPGVGQIKFLKLAIFNLLSSSMSDAFIFGEWYKSKMYRLIFPQKPYIFLSYYPELKYLNPEKPTLSKKCIHLSYSGKISKEKGFQNFIKIVNQLAKSEQNLTIKVNIIGEFDQSEKEENKTLLSRFYQNVSFKLFDVLPFESFLSQIKDTDVFIDLRSTDYENQHCLPIKLFYYTAFRRPVIYSDLKAIRKEVDIDRFGFLVNPNDTQRIVQILKDYIYNESLYNKHCKSAAELAETKYNWGRIKNDFIEFLSQLHQT